MNREQEITPRTGAWLCGALGGLATTVVVGALALKRGLAPRHGLVTDAAELAHLGLVDVAGLQFGGHDVRSGSLRDSALEISRNTQSISADWVRQLDSELAAIDTARRPGLVVNAGAAIDRLVEPGGMLDGGLDLASRIARIQADFEAFRRSRRLDRLVVVNLTSTEPSLPAHPAHLNLTDLRTAIRDDRRDLFRSSLLYSYAALDLGLPFINFTPSMAFPPAIVELAHQRGAPFMGSDGKSGETLVKSALAPMFRQRALRVLSWQGYNILGDRDGQVLADRDNLATKVESKDRLVSSILGYPLHTHVGIDYVPSLNDLKTAWDFIHFEGFLGHRMSMQFIWQGCDAILAAPLVLDLIRMAELAARLGESGPMRHLACFFKSPFQVDEHDLHRQWELLRAYAATRGAAGPVHENAAG